MVETKTHHHIELGRQGENLAAAWLSESGYRIYERNWRSSRGEVDIIAEHQGMLVAVEVKTRSSTAFGAGAETVSERQLRRVQHGVLGWARAHIKNGPFPPIRTDLIEVLVSDNETSLQLYQDVQS